MPKFAYVGVAADGSSVKGTEKAPSRGDAEIALYERQLRNLRVTEKTGLLQYECTASRMGRPARRNAAICRERCMTSSFLILGPEISYWRTLFFSVTRRSR